MNAETIYNTFFLSRLRGGEPSILLLSTKPLFLSRLRGGELLDVVGNACDSFLSRLRGGEPENKALDHT